MKHKKLGELLQERGKISAPDLAKIISEQQRKVIHLGELMLQRGLVQKFDLSSALEEITGVPYLDCTIAQPSSEALALIPETIARRSCSLPIERKESRLIVVMAEPQNLVLLDELQFASGAEIAPRMGFRKEILLAIGRCYTSTHKATDNEAEAGIAGTDETPELEFSSVSSRQASRQAFQEIQTEIHQKRSPAVRVVSDAIWTAMERQASDIHIEPQIDDTLIRIRVDGVLHDLLHIPRALQNALVSRIKILSDMDISERRVPQDGRFMVSIGKQHLDMRVSTLPTQYGEKVVMRLLESEAPLLTFAQLGFPPLIEERLVHLLSVAAGHASSDRTDRVRKEHDSLLGVAFGAQILAKHRHGRRSSRVCSAGHQSGPRQHACGPDVCQLHSLHPPPRSQCDHGGRNSRPRDRRNCHEGGPGSSCKNEVLNSLRQRQSLHTWSMALISSDKTCADTLTENCSSSLPRRMFEPSWRASDEPSKMRRACLLPI